MAKSIRTETMAQELSKVYNPKEIEEFAEDIWFSGGYFRAEPTAKGGLKTKSFTIVIPPPNVTAALHLGHALNNTLQDVLIRFRRMQGFNTLWMPGTDHAGIATQTVVEKRILSEENKRRTDFTREEFVARVIAWKDEYEAKIIEQLQAMGCSCDWRRTRFTMDETCGRAVRAAFYKLFEDGLIYRGKRLVNWDPATQTVLADDEVEYETVLGHFWYLRYPLVEPVVLGQKTIEYVTVATTRPETMLGDTAVAMNPGDKLAKYLVGRKVRLPIVGRIIPIIADDHVVLPDPNSEDEKARFSTGFLKVTPAHDGDDWEIGRRHNLDVINVMAPDGTISDKFGWADAHNSDSQFLLGMDRFEAREAIVEWFRQENLLENAKEYTHEVGHSYRSHVPIEPYLSDQWYIAVKKPIEPLAEKFGTGVIDETDVPVNSLAGLALKPLLDGRLKFIPSRYSDTYRSWLVNLRDWPISRQLWWGHRIPIWVEPDESFRQIAGTEDTIESLQSQGRICVRAFQERRYVCVNYASDSEAVAVLEEAGFRQDPDVLDTWFSSALWPFSTLGWPEDSPELQTYYPGNVLCTAREIITLWVSRMVMMGQYCVGDIPFSDVYIHAMIQDGEGRKMSKSLGNGIDPLVAIDSHGADAMRFTLVTMSTETQDIRMPVVTMALPDGREANTSPKFDIGRNFCNKLWNASRFVLMNLEGIKPEDLDTGRLSITDKWILSRLGHTVGLVTGQLEQYKFSEPLMELYKFFWNDLCDWYLEWAKPRLRNDADRTIVQNVLAFVLDKILRLLHPFVPFITEGIFQKLNEIAPVRAIKFLEEARPSRALVVADWPRSAACMRDSAAENEIAIVQSVIRAIRDIRTKYNKPNELLVVSARPGKDDVDILNRNASLICQLAGAKEFKAGVGDVKPCGAAVAIADASEVYVHNVINQETERVRLEKQKQQLEKARESLAAKLGNKDFVSKAKPAVVKQVEMKLAEVSEQLKTVERHLAELAG